jgi:hypothetical protein
MIFGSMSRTGLHWMIKLLSSAKPSQESLFAVLNALFQVHKNKAHPALAFETEYYTFIMFLSGYLTGETSDSAFSFTRSGFGWKTDVGFFFANSRFLYSFHEDVEIHRKFLEFYRKADPAKYYKFPTALRRKRRLYQKIGLEINSWNAVWAQVTLMGIEDALSVFMQNEIYLRGAIALTTIRLYQAKNGLERILSTVLKAMISTCTARVTMAKTTEAKTNQFSRKRYIPKKYRILFSTHRQQANETYHLTADAEDPQRYAEILRTFSCHCERSEAISNDPK